MKTPYVMFGNPDCSSMPAWNELAVRLITTDPTEVAASLVFVVQSPWAGLFVPNATVSPVAGTDVDVDVEGVVALWLFEQADTKAKAATSTTETTAMDRRCNEVRIRSSLCGRLGANQGLSY